MRTELALEFIGGYQWLDEIGSQPESPFKRFIRRIKRMFCLL